MALVSLVAAGAVRYARRRLHVLEEEIDRAAFRENAWYPEFAEGLDRTTTREPDRLPENVVVIHSRAK